MLYEVITQADRTTSARFGGTGLGLTTVPIFLLVPQVKLRKRLDLARDASYNFV